MSQRDRDQLQRLIDRCTVAAPVDHVPLVELDEGETLLAVLRDVELIELRVTPLPLLGGSSSFDYGEASVLSGPTPQLRRGIELDEPVPARDRGALMLTDRRVSFVGTKTRHWSLARLQDITHDPGVPESWLAVSNRKRLSGVRYVGQAVEFRFALALAVADARGDRRALASSLRRQQQAYPPAVAPVAVPAAVTSEVVVQGRQRTGSRALVSAAVFGKPGVAMPLRVLQTVGVALVAIVLLALLVPGNDPSDGKDAAVRLTDAGAAAGRSAPPTTAAQSEAGQAAADKQAADKQAADKLAADKAAAEKADVDRAAADKAAADKAAADKAAADKLAADKRAADKLAADKLAADKAAADKSSADKAAAAPAGGSGAGCTPEYPDFCIPQKAGDAYNCGDFTQKDFTARQPDPYRLDRDKDGIACQS